MILAEQNFTEQAKTLKAAKRLLKKVHKAVIIRPTGFGKTWILTELIKNYNKVLYLYPSAVIRDTVVNRYYDSMFDDDSYEYVDENGEILEPDTVDDFIAMKKIDKCTLMTYAKLINLTNDDFAEMDYDLVLCDECHKMGGPKTKIAVEKLFHTLGSKADFVGATATPTRMDNFDVVSHFFSDNMVYSYTLYDAIRDGLVQKPNYCYATYDIETDLKDAALAAGEDPKDPTVKEVINAKLIELADIFNMPNIIKDICDKYASNTSYMKFIIFFADRQHMRSKINDVEKWFKDAYPDHTIDTLRISSHSKEESKNVSRLDELVSQPNHIDLIACVDMLNMGYHVNDLTGILMYRGTKSNTIFTQQLGRALSVGTNNSAIVFDIVDNLHRKAVYELRANLTNKKKKRNNYSEQTKILTDYSILDDRDLVLVTPDNEIITSQYHIDDNGNIVDMNGNPSTLIYDATDNRVYNISQSDDERKNDSILTKNCLNAVGHEATYREIIAKAMAEPMTQRCKYAFELHFRSWCFNHKIEYPISNEKLKKIHDLDKRDFYNEFLNLIKSNNIAYPLQDAESLLAIGSNDEDVPLKICAKARNVSVSQILDMLGL